MSRASRKLREVEQQPAAPITAADGLPDVVPISESQRIALNALVNEQQQLQRSLDANRAALTEVLGEIATATVSVEALATRYQFVGREFVKGQPKQPS